MNPFLNLRDLLIEMTLADRGVNAPGRAGQEARRAYKAASRAVRAEIARLVAVGAYSSPDSEFHHNAAMAEVDAVRWNGTTVLSR